MDFKTTLSEKLKNIKIKPLNEVVTQAQIDAARQKTLQDKIIQKKLELQASQDAGTAAKSTKSITPPLNLGEDLIPGGKGDDKTVNDIVEKYKCPIDVVEKELELGIKTEMEHTTDPVKAKEIATDHIYGERIDYYSNPKNGLIASEKNAEIEKTDKEIETIKVIPTETPEDIVIKEEKSYENSDPAEYLKNAWKKLINRKN